MIPHKEKAMIFMTDFSSCSNLSYFKVLWEEKKKKVVHFFFANIKVLDES